MGDATQTTLLGAAIAAASGVVVALFTYALSLWHEARLDRRLRRNTRTLLALEVESNRSALRAFWTTINALDTEPYPPEDARHLTAMFSSDLLTYALPEWSVVRWHHLAAKFLPALRSKELLTLDTLYRDLDTVRDLHTRLVTMTPENWADLRRNMDGRFWANDLARERMPFYTRLAASVTRVLDAPALDAPALDA